MLFLPRNQNVISAYDIYICISLAIPIHNRLCISSVCEPPEMGHRPEGAAEHSPGQRTG